MKTSRFFIPFFMGAIAFVAIYPVIFLLLGSLMGSVELTQNLGAVLNSTNGYAKVTILPLYPTLKSYVEVLLDLPEFFVMFWNSIKLCMGILVGQLLVGVPGAWGFAKGRFPGRKLLFTMYLLLMMMPFQVLMLPDYLVLNRLNLLDSHLGLILLMIFSPFPVFIMHQFFANIPEGLLEAARLDGAGEVEIFFRIAVPLGSPGILSAMVLGFLEYWNLVEQPMTFLKTKSLWPLSLYLPNIDLTRAGPAFAASAIALVPAILVFLAGQDYLERGIMAIAIKE